MTEVPRAIKMFEAEQELENYLRQHTFLSEKEISRDIEHERQHAEAARRLGYRNIFGVEITYDKIPRLTAFVIQEPTPTPEHLRLILSAPTTLSPSDIKQLEDLS